MSAPDERTQAKSTLQSFVSAFKYNVGLQLIARVLSFGVNFYLFRVVSTEVLGIANVRFAFPAHLV